MEGGHFSKFQRAVETNNKRAIKSGAIAALTLDEFEAAYIYFGGKCAYSGRDFSGDNTISIEHIIPIMSGGHSMAFNCIPVRVNYNSSKSGYHLLDWWKCQTDGTGKSVYNPYRLLKVLNYMVKCLEAVGLQEPTVHILTDNKIDVFLGLHKGELDSNTEKTRAKNDFRKISQIEVLTKMDMIKIEDLYSIYSELDNIRLNTAIFFEETIHELEGEIPKDILEEISTRINALPDIYIEGKKVFKKEMNPKDIKIRKEVLAWTEREGLENKYGIIGYMDFEVLKLQQDVTRFLDDRKQLVLDRIGITLEDFNNVMNKVPNILTDLTVEERLDRIAQKFKMSNKINNGKSSELYRYISSKPDLLLAGENMEILLRYADELNIDKRILKRGIPITTIIDNIEMAIELVNLAEIDVNENTKRRILNKLINGTTGNLLRDAYREFRKNIKLNVEGVSVEQIKRDAARWIICISEKYNAAEILKPRRMAKTSELYKNMEFNEEGYMKGINPNAYIVPQIVSLAELDISREAESEIINNVFFVNQIRQGRKANEVLKDLCMAIKKDSPNISNEEMMKLGARWFVFLSESSQVHLGVMFDKKVKEDYINITQKYYQSMKFDDRGNFIDQNMPELNKFAVGVDYMKIADSYIKSKGDFYIIRGQYVPKKEIQDKLYSALSKCKNKRTVKSTCIRILKELTGEIKKRGGEEYEK